MDDEEAKVEVPELDGFDPNDLEEGELENIQDESERGALLRSMLETRGWKDVFAPALVERRRALVQKLLAEAKDVNQFILLQQSINAIDMVFNYAAGVIQLGNIAIEKLKRIKK